MKIRILGCGPSNGVPSLSRGFGACDAHNPKNIRTRSSALITTNENQNILIDTGPEIRLQLLKANNPKIDALFFTHIHYDHMGGVNDLSAFLLDKHDKIPVYLTEETARYFKAQLSYLFNTNTEPFELNIVKPYEPFFVGQTKVIPIKQYHGNLISIGYRIDNFAYSTDVKSMEDMGFELLKGIKTWVLGVVSSKKDPNKPESIKHIYLDEAIKWIENIKPEKAYLTHMGQKMDYETLCKTLPAYIRPVYDGFEFEA